MGHDIHEDTHQDIDELAPVAPARAGTVDMSVDLAGVRLPSPMMTASGCAANGPLSAAAAVVLADPPLLSFSAARRGAAAVSAVSARGRMRL